MTCKDCKFFESRKDDFNQLVGFCKFYKIGISNYHLNNVKCEKFIKEVEK